jgi:glutathione reductase (NADPH)
MPESTHDLVVIGIGSRSAPAASKCAADGWFVAIIDDQPFSGSDPARDHGDGIAPRRLRLPDARLRHPPYGLTFS